MTKKWILLTTPLALFTATLMTGCIRTTSEIKPIHITMDINLKVDRELDNFFSDIDEAPAKPAEVKAEKPVNESKEDK